MLWSNIRSWAKEKGYKTSRSKVVSQDNGNEEAEYNYVWSKLDDENIQGEASSVSKLAKAIYNNITEGIHIEYQQQYVLKQTMQEDIHYNE
jgi:hypothetical protein